MQASIHARIFPTMVLQFPHESHAFHSSCDLGLHSSALKPVNSDQSQPHGA